MKAAARGSSTDVTWGNRAAAAWAVATIWATVGFRARTAATRSPSTSSFWAANRSSGADSAGATRAVVGRISTDEGGVTWRAGGPRVGGGGHAGGAPGATHPAARPTVRHASRRVQPRRPDPRGPF